MSRTASSSPGGSQAVRLPADCRFPGKEVFIHQEGERVCSRPNESWTEYLAQGPRASADFMEGIDDLPVQERRFT
jgi:antitoxin VapB